MVDSPAWKTRWTTTVGHDAASRLLSAALALGGRVAGRNGAVFQIRWGRHTAALVSDSHQECRRTQIGRGFPFQLIP